MPKPISPVLPGYADQEHIYAKDQPEYNPLPVLRSEGSRRRDGVLLSRWQFTDAEREAIAAGADIFLYCWTFNHPLQPVLLEVGCCDRDEAGMARYLGLAPDVAGVQPSTPWPRKASASEGAD